MRSTMPSINVRLISGGGGGSICRLLVAGVAEGTGRGESTCSRMAAKSFLPKRARSAWSGDSPSRRRVIQSGTSLKTTVFPMRSCTMSGWSAATRTAILIR